MSPVEQVWNDVKYDVKVSNIDQNLNKVIERAKNIMENYDVEKWKKHGKHIEKYGVFIVSIMSTLSKLIN